MNENKQENRGFWNCLSKLMDAIEELFSGRTYSDYEIYGDDYQRD